MAPSTGDAPSPSPFLIPDLRDQYFNEQERRSSGISKAIWGLALIGGSHLALNTIPPFKIPDPEEYDDSEEYQSALDVRKAAETGQSVVQGLGYGLMAWGITEIGWGWYRMSQLELDLPREAEASLDEQYLQASEDRDAGKGKLWWGIFFAGASYAVVEWVPYFEVPDEAEYEDPDEYMAAVDRRERAEEVNTWVTVGGAALAAWGTTQWVLAARKMSEIEATARATAFLVPTGDADTLVPDLFVGRERGRTQLGVQWTW